MSVHLIQLFESGILSKACTKTGIHTYFQKYDLTSVVALGYDIQHLVRE